MKTEEKIKKLLDEKATVTFTFVGDSVTFGQFIGSEETFAAVFTRLLANKYKNTSVYRYDGGTKYEEVLIQSGTQGRINVIRSGVCGSTVKHAINRFESYTGILPSNSRSDFIFTMFGANDALIEDASKYATPEKFKENYNELVCKLKKSEPQAAIILMTLATSPFPCEEHVEKNKELADEEGLNLIDIYALWKAHYSPEAKNLGYGDWLRGAHDPYHPSPTGAKAIGEYIYDSFFNMEI